MPNGCATITSDNANINKNKQKLYVKSYESFRRRRRSVYKSQIQITTSIYNAINISSCRPTYLANLRSLTVYKQDLCFKRHKSCIAGGNFLQKLKRNFLKHMDIANTNSEHCYIARNKESLCPVVVMTYGFCKHAGISLPKTGTYTTELKV